MSEKPKEKPWQDEIREIVQAEMQKFQSPVAQTTPPSSIPPKAAEPPKHFDPKDLETNCPECQKKIEAWKASVIDDARAKFDKEHPQFCLDCGTYVKQEDEECPHCHGRRGKARE